MKEVRRERTMREAGKRRFREVGIRERRGEKRDEGEKEGRRRDEGEEEGKEEE